MRPLRMIPEMNSIRQNGNLERTVRLLKAVDLIDVYSLIDVYRGVRWNDASLRACRIPATSGSSKRRLNRNLVAKGFYLLLIHAVYRHYEDSVSIAFQSI